MQDAQNSRRREKLRGTPGGRSRFMVQGSKFKGKLCSMLMRQKPWRDFLNRSMSEKWSQSSPAMGVSPSSPQHPAKTTQGFRPALDKCSASRLQSPHTKSWSGSSFSHGRGKHLGSGFAHQPAHAQWPNTCPAMGGSPSSPGDVQGLWFKVQSSKGNCVRC